MTKQVIGTTSVDEGRAILEHTFTDGEVTPGSHTVYATYIENDHYQTATANNTAVVKISTTTTLNSILGSIGEAVTFTATVNHHTSQQVTGGQVQFKIGENNAGSPQPVSNGVATLTNYEIPQGTTDGTTITAIYTGDSTYGASQGTNTLSIRGSTNTTLSDMSVNRGDTATIVATFTDSQNNPITTGQAKLYIDNTQQGETVTVTSAGASFTYNVASNAVVGGHTMRVEYLQNDDYDGSQTTATLIVRTPTVLTATNISTNPGTTTPLTVTVKDDNNGTVTTGTVRITLGQTTNDATVNSSTGEATANFEIPANATGTLTFTAVYVENTNYQGTVSGDEASGTITIRKSVTIVVDNVNTEFGEQIELSSSIVDSDNELVDEGTVQYEIE